MFSIFSSFYSAFRLLLLQSLYQYPRLALMPKRLQILAILFAFFIFLCGAGHSLRCMELTGGSLFRVTNFFTATVSLATCLYLIPLVPSLMSSLDENLQSLKHLNAELEASKRKLMTFMAFLCHEIRNPLFVITSNVSFLEDNNGAERPSKQVQEQVMQAISQSADVMLRLVNDVLDISKLESGKLELQEHDFNLRETLEGVTNSTHRLIAQKHRGDVQFVTHISDRVPRGVFADSVRFLQIVYNLLSNANKFTEHGEIRFVVSVVDTTDTIEEGLVTIPGVSPPTPVGTAQWLDSTDSSNNNTNNKNNGYEDAEDFGLLLDGVRYGQHATAFSSSTTAGLTNSSQRSASRSGNGLDDHVVLKIQVQDTGVGIPPDQLERLFQPYAQSKLSNYRKHGGTGLGLAIVSKLTLAMGGNVRVKSEIGQGSSFEVYLPFQVSNVSLNSPNEVNAFANFRKRNSFENLSAAAVGVELSAVRTPVPETTLVTATAEGGSRAPPPPPSISTTPYKKKLVPFGFSKGTGVVLVVDDNDMNRKLLKRMLSQFNLEHREAANGREAVDVMLNSRNFNNQNPDAPEIALVLMDLSMPIMDGYEAISTIRQYREFANLPIIALTAATIEEGKQRAIEVGVTEYQTKPIKRDVLYTLCQRYLHTAAVPKPAMQTSQVPPDLLLT